MYNYLLSTYASNHTILQHLKEDCVEILIALLFSILYYYYYRTIVLDV